MVFNLFKSGKRRREVEALYVAISAASRAPDLYLNLAVPDTVEGRFESLILHVSLVLRRLKELPQPALDISKDLVDDLFKDLDGALRELGVGDLSVGKKIKALAQAFYGRAKALDAALADPDPAQLEVVLTRNVLGIADGAVPQGAALASYVRRASELLSEQSLAGIMKADRLFPAP